MEKKQAFNQIMEFNKTAFNHTFTAITLLQEQTQRMINLSLEQATILPKEGKKVFTEWLDTLRKGSETFKKSVDDGFQKLEALFA